VGTISARCATVVRNAAPFRGTHQKLPHNAPMHRTGPAVSFPSVERGSLPARPVIGKTFGDYAPV
jgi:hypothetical protein